MNEVPNTNALIDSLVAESAPVRRLRPSGLRLSLWLVVQIAIAAYVFSGGVRADIGGQLASPLYLVQLAILAAAITLLARAAINAGTPGSEAWSSAKVGVTLMVVALGFLAAYPANTALEISLFSTFGFPCAVRTAMLSLLPTSWLLAAIYRGWALSPARAGLVAGAAGFVLGFTMMRVLCALDDPLHVMAWHWAPVLLGCAVSAAAGALIFSFGRK